MNNASEINRLHQDFYAGLRTSIGIAVQIGELLITQKRECGHGNWLPWVKANLTFKVGAAKEYMRIFRHWGNRQLPDNLTLKEAARVSTESCKEDFIETDMIVEQIQISNRHSSDVLPTERSAEQPQVARPVNQGKVSPKMREDMLKARAEGQSLVEIAKAFGLAKSTVHGVVRDINKVKLSKSEKLKWTSKEEAENEACLAIINAPSKFPHDAPIPESKKIGQALNTSEAHLRGDIIWLREHEGKIASFNAAQVFEMQLRTNGIQAYHTNFHGFARPDGELDQRILDWAHDLWVRQRRQETRLELLAKLRPPRKKKEEEPLERKAQRPFDDRFKTFWMLIEDSLSLFKANERTKLTKTFSLAVKEFFSDLSAENRGAAVVADAQKESI